jgi:small conductance mechanosensitive channel
MAPLAQVSPSAQVLESVNAALRSFFALLPRVLLAAVVLAVFIVIARVLRARLEPRLADVRTPSFGRVFATLIAFGVGVLGLAVALPIAFPSLSVAAMLGGLGLVGVAAGFAFQDILSNLLAGVLLLFRQPFRGGDQIQVGEHRGTVEAITIRETRLKTFDGRLVIIPNADVYTSAIEVQTHYDRVRSSFVTGVGYGTDLSTARAVALRTLAGVEGVLEDPPPEAYYVDHGASAVGLDLRYWTRSPQAEVRRVQDRVAQAIHDAFEEADIDIPFDIVTLEATEEFAQMLGGGR